MQKFYASKTGEVSAREKEHSALVRELAGECMTLLENDGTLPLAGAGKVAVYGNGVRHTVKGGTGVLFFGNRRNVRLHKCFREHDSKNRNVKLLCFFCQLCLICSLRICKHFVIFVKPFTGQNFKAGLF